MKYSPMRILGRLFGGNSQAPANSLRGWSLGFAGLFAAQAAVLLLLSDAREIPLYVDHLTGDALQSRLTGTHVEVQAASVVANVNVVYLLAAMLLLSALIALLTATVWRSAQGAWLQKGWQPTRWIMAAVIASGMEVSFSLLAGIRTIDAVVLIIGLTIAACIAGSAFELHQKGRRKLDLESSLLVVVAILGGFLPWLDITKTMAATNLFGSVAVPAYLWWLLVSAILGWLLIAGCAFLGQRARGKWENYDYAEHWYLVLLFVTASAFCWQLYAAMLHP